MRIVYYFQITRQRDYDNTVEEQTWLLNNYYNNTTYNFLLKRHNQAKIIKKTIFLFLLPNLLIWP